MRLVFACCGTWSPMMVRCLFSSVQKANHVEWQVRVKKVEIKHTLSAFAGGQGSQASFTFVDERD